MYRNVRYIKEIHYPPNNKHQTKLSCSNMKEAPHISPLIRLFIPTFHNKFSKDVVTTLYIYNKIFTKFKNSDIAHSTKQITK